MRQKINPLSVKILARGGIKWVEFMGSSFLFAAVYLLLYVGYDFATSLAAKHFDLEPILFFDRIQYLNNDQWYPHCVKRTFIVGPLLMLSVGIFSYLLYIASRKTYIFIRLFLVWTSVISFAILGQRLLSVPFDSRYELGIYSAYMYFEQSTNYAIAFMGVVMLIAVGMLFAKPFLQTASSSAQVANDGNRRIFFNYQVILPFLVGSAIAMLVPFPSNIVPNAVAFLCCGIILGVITFQALTMGPVKLPKQTQWERWPIVPSVILLLTILAYRTILTIGMKVPDPDLLF